MCLSLTVLEFARYLICLSSANTAYLSVFIYTYHVIYVYTLKSFRKIGRHGASFFPAFLSLCLKTHLAAPTHLGPIGRCLPLHGPNLKPWAMTPWMHGTHRGGRLKRNRPSERPPKVSNEKRVTACFGFIGDEILPHLCGDYRYYSIVNHYKNPY